VTSPYEMSDDMPVYVISVAAQLAGMHPQTLRAYDRIGLVSPGRSAGRGRRYSMRDILALREIQRLSQDEGVNLSGIKLILDQHRELDQARRLVAELHAEIAQLRVELESTRAVDTIVLDKTGTITTGRMSLADAAAVPGTGADRVLRLAGAVEYASEHPVAAAIAAGARERLGDDLPAVTEFASHRGLGVSGVVDGHAVVVGRAGWLETEWAQQIPAGLAARAAGAERAGQTAVFAGWDGQVRGVLVVTDTIRPTSAQAITRLRAMGLRPVLLTGDNEGAARTVANAVGIDEVVAGVLPAGKVDAIKHLQDRGRVVAMVGDGVNDAAALAQADLGLAMGTGTDAAIEASDLTVVRGDLLAVPDAILLSRRTLTIIKGNLAWAFGYNIAAIPLAALGFLSPLIAAAAMAFSSVFVVSNSLRLRRFGAD